MPRQKHVVYILGAGFSAPLGVPTVSSFLQAALDLQEAQPGDFGYFDEIFQFIRTLERANNFYRTDRTNIEDLLTIVDLTDELNGRDQASLFRKFIADVIRSSTPVLRQDPNPSHWYDIICGARPWTAYGAFTAAVLGYEFTSITALPPEAPRTVSDYACRVVEGADTRYSVISLNYDLVLEIAAAHINKTMGTNTRSFVSKRADQGTPLIKLHGSIDKNNIVPPIWNKNYTDIAGVWREAFDVLTTANQIRIVGYSLPEADSYIRYLLRAAAVESKNLQRIDVLCLDPDGRVQERYANFVALRDYYRGGEDKGKSFNGGHAVDYLLGYQDGPQWQGPFRPYEGLERTHGRFFPD